MATARLKLECNLAAPTILYTVPTATYLPTPCFNCFQVEKYSTTLETLLFTQDLDPNILDVFHQFVALRM
jgi:hypothetical protein